MTPLRAFIALEFPESLQAAIYKETARLREAAGPAVVRWVPAENMHLTLKFLGDVPSSNLEFINQVLSTEAAKIRGFTLSVGGMGAFPNLKRARVVWIKQSAAIPDQQRLRRALESTEIGQIGKTEIRSVALMRSELRPTGSIYTQLFSASLAPTLKPEVKSESS